jgi:serine/threonine-protein kinase
MSDENDITAPIEIGTGPQTGIDGRVNPNLPETTLALGDKERYEVQHVLGQGGMGVVFLSHDRRLGRTIALKVMRTDRDLGDDGRARFLREVRVQGQLEHPSIVPVYDLALNATGDPFFTMRRLDGRTLQETLDELRLGPPGAAPAGLRRLLGAFCQVCLAVDFAHSRGIVHRDLKPANVMLGTYGEVMVLDWGVARWLDEADDDTERTCVQSPGDGDMTQTGFVLGSPGYIPPEQLAGERATARSDVYALGAILFEILSLERLQRGLFPSRDSLAEPGVAQRLAALPFEVPPELIDACAHATAPRAERTPSARLLGDAVQSYLDGERNAEMRVAVAETHALAAEAAGLEEGTAQKTALREIGRALALDPANARAQSLLRRFFLAPVTQLPAELAARQQAAESQRILSASRVAGAGYLTLLLYLPVLIYMGIRSPALVGALYAGLLAAVAASLSLGLRPHWQLQARVQLTLVTGMLLVGLTSTVFGPLLAVPPFAVGNTVAWAILLDRRGRATAIALGVLAMWGPFAFEWTGVIPSSVAFTEQGIVILPRAVALPELPTLVLVLVTGAMTVIVSAFSVGRVSDALRSAEQRLLMQSWKFEQLAPVAEEVGK